MRIRAIAAATLLAALLAAAPAGATVFRTGGLITIGPNEVIPDDLIAAGQSVLVEGQVQGDVIAAASTVRIPGRVTGNVMALAQTVDIPGTVSGSLRTASQHVSIAGHVGRNASVAAQGATVSSGSTVGRDLDIAAGSATMDGAVLGRAAVAANNAQIGGTVGRDLRFSGDRLALRPTARVVGKLISRSPGRPTLAQGALVGGGVELLPPPRRQPQQAGMVPLARNLLIGLALFVTGAVLLWLVPRFLRTAADVLGERPGWSILWGIILLVVVPIVATFVIFTLIGLPLGLLALALWGFAILLSAIPVGLWLGRLIAHWIQPDATWSPYAHLAMGLLTLAILFSVPLLGGLVRLLVLLFGIGMFALAAYRLTGRREAGAGPGPATPAMA